MRDPAKMIFKNIQSDAKQFLRKFENRIYYKIHRVKAMSKFMVTCIALILIIVTLLAPLLLTTKSVAYATKCTLDPSPSYNCGGSARDCVIPYHGRGGHAWEGILSYGQFIQQCVVMDRTGCCDFC